MADKLDYYIKFWKDLTSEEIDEIFNEYLRTLRFDFEFYEFKDKKYFAKMYLNSLRKTKRQHTCIHTFGDKIYVKGDAYDKNERIKGKVSDQAYLENKEQIVICEGVVVEPGAYIAGPTFIGPNAIVRHGAYVRGSVYISEGAVVGHTTECKGSIFLPFAKAAHFNYVGDSILGYDCNLGAGTKLANLKMNHK